MIKILNYYINNMENNHEFIKFYYKTKSKIIFFFF